MTKLNIKYSVDFEVDMVFNTLQKIEWYKEKGYKLTLPFGIFTEGTETLNKESIKEAVTKEYNEEYYKEISEDILDKWQEIGEDFLDKFSDISIKPLEEYVVFITKYGVGGSYNLPGKIIINVGLMNNKRHIEVIIHEIIHLMIEHLIQKYKISHWTKERIVDLIFSKILPSLAKEQNLSGRIDIKEIDGIFNKYFPDIESTIRTIGEV